MDEIRTRTVQRLMTARLQKCTKIYQTFYSLILFLFVAFSLSYSLILFLFVAFSLSGLRPFSGGIGVSGETVGGNCWRPISSLNPRKRVPG